MVATVASNAIFSMSEMALPRRNSTARIACKPSQRQLQSLQFQVSTGSTSFFPKVPDK